MTKVEADALLDAFLTANKAGQEELWRASHPEAPDGPTVLILWLLGHRYLGDRLALERALMTIDDRCAFRVAIYAAIAAHPAWAKYCGKVIEKQYCVAPGDAIRAAIAYYSDPTEDSCQDTHRAWRFALEVAARTAACAASAAAEAAGRAAGAAHHVARHYSDRSAVAGTVHAAVRAVNTADIVINAMVAAIVDHYEGRPLEMP